MHPWLSVGWRIFIFTSLHQLPILKCLAAHRKTFFSNWVFATWCSKCLLIRLLLLFLAQRPNTFKEISLAQSFRGCLQISLNRKLRKCHHMYYSHRIFTDKYPVIKLFALWKFIFVIFLQHFRLFCERNLCSFVFCNTFYLHPPCWRALIEHIVFPLKCKDYMHNTMYDIISN